MTILSVKIEHKGSFLDVVSLYCRPSEPIDGYLTKVSDILKVRRNENFLIGGDFNRKSDLWLSGTTDELGSKLEEVVFAWYLQVLNECSRFMSFDSNQGGKSNIDVTLVTRRIVSYVQN